MDSIRKLQDAIKNAEGAAQAVVDAFYEAVQDVADRHGVLVATRKDSNFWQIKKPGFRRWIKEPCNDETPVHEAMMDLVALDKLVERMGVEPTNGLMIKPRKKKSDKDRRVRVTIST